MPNLPNALIIGSTIVLIAVAQAVSGATWPLWLEAEWFRDAQRYPLADASGAETAIAEPAAPAPSHEVRNPGGDDLHVWVRIADVTGVRRTGSTGLVVVNGEPSPHLVGTGRGMVWYRAGRTSAERVRIELKGLTTDPNECFFDVVMITTDGSLDGEGIAARQADLRRAGWRGRGPRVALVHGTYARGACVPADAWDEDLVAMGCLVEKWPAADVMKLAGELGHYDVVLFTVMYRWGAPASVYLNDLGAPLSGWVRAGGLLLVAGAREDADVAWLRNISPELALGLGPSATGRPGNIAPALRTPHPLADGLDEWPLFYNLLPWPGFPHCSWPSLDVSGGHASGAALITDGDQRPLLHRLGLGEGAVVVTTLFHGRGLDGWLFENLWSAHAAKRGRAYGPRPSPPTLEQELSGYPGPVGAAASAVGFDAQGTMLIDGVPFFPVGFYLVTREDSLPLLKEKGFNAVFGLTPDLTDAAAAHDIRVVAQVTLDPDTLPAVVQRRRAQPAFVAYAIAQEPEVPRRALLRNIGIVHKADPDRPVFLLVDHAATFPGLAGLGDFIVTDPYCVQRPDSPLNKISDHVRDLRHLHPSKPVWTVLPAMRFAHWVVPTPAQFRAINYLAVVSGSRGVFWFAFDETENKTISYIRYADGHFEQPAWDTLCDLAGQMRQLTPWLVSPSADALIRAAGPEPAVHAAMWGRGGRHLLIVVNSLAEPREAVIAFERPFALEGPFFDEAPPARVDGPRLDVQLPGYGVGIYRLRSVPGAQTP